MIRSRQDLKEYMKCDRERNGIKNNCLNYLLKLFLGYEQAHAVRYLRNLRKTEYYLNCSKYIYKLAYYWCAFRHKRMSLKYGIALNPNIAGKGLHFTHFNGGITLNAKSIGDFCSFNSGSLLGNNRGQDNRPTIGNHVTFGPGAKAIGKIEIKDHCFIAANAVVTKDMPSHSIIGGIPAKIIKTNS